MRPDEKTLEQLYLTQKMSVYEIGRRYNVAGKTVHRWLVAAAIPRRSLSEAASVRQAGKPKSESHRRALAENLKKARAARTPEGVERSKKNLQPGQNKGKKWTPEQRAAHMAYRRTPEYRQKLAETKKGAKAYQWQGGTSRESTASLRTWEWRERRQECYQRDNWTCQDCKAKCGTKGTRRIQAHHVIPRRLGGGDELSNLVTLCMSCHHKRERRYANAMFA